MPNFDQTLLDGADPAYAPGSKREGNVWIWAAPAKYRKAGYAAHRQRLPEEALDRARLCREYTRDMLRWWNGEDKPIIKAGTFGWLIRRYLTDEFSPFQDVKSNTQQSYRDDMAYWEGAIGTVVVADMDLAQIKGLQKAMRERGRSVDFIHRKFNALRRVARYGMALKVRDCRDLSEVLANVRIAAPQPRDTAPTAAQIMAVVVQADQHGRRRFSLGLLIQWWLSLRPMDVRGDFFPIKADETKDGGIVRGNFRWGDGLTWDQVAPDLMSITRVISKTERHDARPVTFDLSDLHDLRARLAEVEPRIGPVIINENTGLPFDRSQWRDLWRKFADMAGVPKDVQIRDTRAGAITEADSLGATEEMTMHQGTHSKSTTTRRYIRNRDEQVAKVIALRAGTRNEP